MQHSQLCSLADYNTHVHVGKNLDSVASNIKSDINMATSWYTSRVVVNLEKFQLMFMDLKDDIKVCFDINDIVVQMTDSVKVLGATIDSMSSFSHHIQSIHKNSNKVSFF